MNTLTTWFDGLREQTRKSRRKARAKQLRAQRESKARRFEQLEQRVVMDAKIGLSPLFVTAVGEDAKWQSNALGNCNPRPAGNGTCVTTNPVTIAVARIGAPDGGTNVFRSDPPTPVGRLGTNEFYPKNGLLTLQNDHEGITSFAQQQEIDLTRAGKSGIFALTWNGQTTVPLNIGASAEGVQKALTDLSTIGAAGGNVTVTRSTNGEKYVVTFGGNTWFRPPLISVASSVDIRVNPITTLAITKRDDKSAIKLNLTAPLDVVDIPNGNTFPIDNAPLFTPEKLTYDGTGDLVSMKGYLRTPAIGGRFDLDTQFQTTNVVNAFREPRQGIFFITFPGGFRATFAAHRDFSIYVLNPLKDSAGNSRPITLFKLGGLDFEAPAGTSATLTAKDAAQNDLELGATGDSMLVSAPFEGGKLTLRMLRDGTTPIYSANLRTGKVTITPKFEFVSFEIGGLVIPQSNSFQMAYNPATEKFTFTINQLSVESPHLTGRFVNSAAGENITQTFELLAGVALTNPTYEAVPCGEKCTPLGSVSEFDNPIHPKVTGTAPWFPIPLPNGKRPLAIRYKTTLKVPATGEYTFTASSSGHRALKINGVLVTSGSDVASTGKLMLTPGEYPLEFTAAVRSSLTHYNIELLMSGPGLPEFSLLHQPQIRYVVAPNPQLRRYSSVTGVATLNPDTVRKAVNEAIDSQTLSRGEKTRLKAKVKISVEAYRVSVTGLPFGLRFSVDDTNAWRTEYQGAVSNPVKMTIPTGTISLTKGKLDPITALTIDSFEIGHTIADSEGNFVTTYEPIKPSSAGGFKAAYFPRNTYHQDGAVDVPGNSFGIYGNQTQLPLNAAGVVLNGLANLGTVTSPALVVTNGQFNRLSYAIPDVKVDNLTFAAASVGSAKPLTVNYFPPQGPNRKSYVVLGGAVLKPGGTLIQTDMKTNFGGNGSDGLRIFPGDNSFTFSFGVAETFLAGTQAIQAAPGLNGLRLNYDPKTKSYNFLGTGFLDFNPTTQHTPTNLAFTGTKLKISATIPDGVTNFPANRLDGKTLNFFFDDRASMNGFLFTPRATTNPLRVSITDTAETVGGAFTMSLDGSSLFGVMEPTAFTGARFPAGGFQLDFTAVAGQPSGYSLGGVVFEDAGRVTLTDTLTLKFRTSKFEGNILAQGAVGLEPNVIEAKRGKITKGEIKSAVAQRIGDVTFQNFEAKYNPAGGTIAGSWSFRGPGTYFGKLVNVGSPGVGNPQLKIGGDPTRGSQLQTIDKPVPANPPQFALPDFVELAGLTFDVRPDAMSAVEMAADEFSKTYSLTTPDYTVKIGNTSLSLSLGMSVKVSSAGAEVVSFSATGKQNSTFSIGNATFQITTLTVEYSLADKALKISGQANFTFTASTSNVEMMVTLGTKQDPGLVIKNGSVESLKVTVDGSFDLLKLSIKAEGLTIAYKKENQEFAIFGKVSVSTAAQGGVQVLKDLAVTLGSEDTPGIKIVSGKLESLDIAIDGEINLFKLTAAPKDLRVRYSSAENQLQITGEVSITLAPKLTITAGLPGDGLLIDTNTGKVQIRGLSLKAEGDIKFGVLTIKGLHVDYEEAANGDVSIGAAAEIELPSGLAVGGSFKIVNGKLDAIGITFEKNPGILVANGLINIYRLEVSVEGLSDLDNFKFKGTVQATVGPLVKFGGESYALADVTGSITITPNDLTLEGEVQLIGGWFGNGKFKGVLAWNETPRVTFDAEVNLFPGDVVRGKISAYADIKGNVDFNATMGVYVPNGIPLAGGASLGNLFVELRVRPAEEPSASYAKFGFSDIAISPIRIPTFHGNVRIGFDRHVEYGFGARFFIPLPWPLPNIDYSLDFSGSFQLRDSDDPRIEIVAASSLSGTPNGEILYVGDTTLPDDTFIDLYADHDDQGNDGLLIASGIPFQEGTQTFTWHDMAAFANPGEPIYVYAVINDGQNATGFSDYSPRFNVAPGFTPTIGNPSSVSFMAGELATFSAATGNPIVIDDPRRTMNPDSEVEVILNVGGGTLDLSHAPDNVRYSGEGSGRITLRGSAADLTDALDGLYYIQFAASDNSDLLDITVRNLPLENLLGGTKSQIAIQPNALSISLVASQHEDIPTEITLGESTETPLADLEVSSLRAAYLTGATIKINNYEPGKDLLNLPMSDSFATGIHAAFDGDTGVLTLTGFDWIEDYELALRDVRFSTMSMNDGKSLTIKLSDDDVQRAEFTVPLDIVAGHQQPIIDVGTNGLLYVNGDGAVPLAPEAFLEVAETAAIQSVTIAFVHDSYIAGEDSLAYSGETFGGEFDAESGILYLSGEGTAFDWAAALQQVTYESLGASFTAGTRYLEITITDDGGENNVASTFFVIATSLTAESFASPVLTLSNTDLNLPANEEFVYLDPELTLTGDAPMLIGATVAISSNYLMGEDELAVTSLWDGMEAEFDPMHGVLNITGVASLFEYEDVLRSVIFIDSAGYRTLGSIEITYTLFDGLTASTGETLTVEIAAAPYIDGDLDNVLVYTEGRTTATIPAEFHIEYEGMISSAAISIAAGFEADQDELIFVDQNNITGSFDPGSGVLTLNGVASAAVYETVLQSVEYRNSRHNPIAGDRILALQVLDGGVFSNESYFWISVEPETVAPQVTLGTATTYTEDGSPVAIAPELSLSPMDDTTPFLSAPELLYGAEVSIVNYFAGEDVLFFTETETIFGEFDPIEGRIYLTGEATFDEYEAALRSILYLNTSEVPTTAARQISIRLLDSGANGLANQTFVTQVVVGMPDPVTLVSGTIDAVSVMQNDRAVSLGLDDLEFDSPALNVTGIEVRFTVTQLPADILGRILLADESRLALNTPYSIGDLAGLRFEPAPGSMGSGEFAYSVALFDPDTGLFDEAALSDTVTISVDGIATTTASQAFVAQAYRDLLHRNPDQTTLSNLANQLDQLLKRIGRSVNGFDSASTARRSLLVDFTSSEAYRGEQVNDLYQSLLSRDATSDELLSIGSLDDIQIGILGSDEYFEQHNASGFSSYLDSLFNDLLNREPTATERTTWIAQLQNGTLPALVAADILTRSVSEGSLRESLESLLTDLMHREPEFEDEFNFDFTSREVFLLSALSSDEYYSLNSTPTNTTRILTHETSDFPSVGTLGDITGDKAGGTLIAPQYVLVAAHSVAGLPPRQLTFTIGGVTHRIASVFIHPDYDSNSLGQEGGNDIAILMLDEPVTNIEPSLLTGRSPRLGDVLNLVGFGEDAGSPFGTKRIGSTPPVDEVGATIFRWTHTSPVQNDSDAGDSGSPLFVNINGVDHVTGLASGGTSSFTGLGDVATNTRIDSYLDWLSSVVPSIQVTDIEDAPSLMFESDDLFIDENASPQTVSFEVSADGPVSFDIDTDAPAMFSSLFVDYDGRGLGEVVFETNVNQRGTAMIFVTAYSGTTSTTQTITLTVEERNDPPTLDPIPLRILKITPGPQTIMLTGISAGIGESGEVRVSITTAEPFSFFTSVGFNSSDNSLAFTPSAGVAGDGFIVVEAREAGEDGQFDTTDDMTTQQLVQVTTTATPPNSWHNAAQPFDVTGDGNVSPIDVLNVINYLLDNGSIVLPARTNTLPPYVDVNNDGFASPLDALSIINHLAFGVGEGESDRFHQPLPASADRHRITSSRHAVFAMGAFRRDDSWREISRATELVQRRFTSLAQLQPTAWQTPVKAPLRPSTANRLPRRAELSTWAGADVDAALGEFLVRDTDMPGGSR